MEHWRNEAEKRDPKLSENILDPANFSTGVMAVILLIYDKIIM
jgi:hypothetical protein